MQRNIHITCPVGLVLLALLLVPRGGAASASNTPTLTTLYTFTGGINGSYPKAGLVQGSDGSFYGTTESAGTYGDGTVYKVSGSGALTTLYAFSAVDSAGKNADGNDPTGALCLGSDGNFYGTTEFGGVNGNGTVFKITPAGKLTTLCSFPGGSDGAFPEFGVIQGSDGNYYGTTYQGGTANFGTMFKITSSGTLTTLHSFTGGVGGLSPSGIVQGSDGNFYGTAYMGGSGGKGTVFAITPAGALTTLYSFSPLSSGINADGADPVGGVVQGSDGNFYGTTYWGGAAGTGTVFKITSSGVLTTLHSFGKVDASYQNADGSDPEARLIQGNDGNFYGTASNGGASDNGTLFKITPSGVVTVLFSFTGGVDGANPRTGLFQGRDGNFYGVTWQGAASRDGTIFKLTSGTSVGSTYALWNHSGQASLWKIPAAGSVASQSFGPYSGWTPSALASDTSGNAYVLWTAATGAASVWKISSSLAIVTSQPFGPYSGWTAKALAVGADGNVHLLWNHTSDNAASIFNIVLGSSMTTKAYGPYSGWQATQIAVDSSNNTRLLWNAASQYDASLWNITSSGIVTSQIVGWYSGWQAVSLAVGSDNQARILWTNTSTKQASIFTVSSSGSVTTNAFGPYSGWSPSGLAVNNDGDSELMWTSTSNALSLFDIGSTGSFTSSSYGPYSGWMSVAIAAGPS